MRLSATIAATVALAVPGKADADDCARACKARVMHKRCDNTHPRACVLHVVYHQRIHGWARAWLLRVPRCESNWNPGAVNSSSGAAGLFQYMPGTWATTPYGHHSIFSARWQSFASAWMLRQGRVGEWACT